MNFLFSWKFFLMFYSIAILKVFLSMNHKYEFFSAYIEPERRHE